MPPWFLPLALQTIAEQVVAAVIVGSGEERCLQIVGVIEGASSGGVGEFLKRTVYLAVLPYIVGGKVGFRIGDADVHKSGIGQAVHVDGIHRNLRLIKR